MQKNHLVSRVLNNNNHYCSMLVNVNQLNENHLIPSEKCLATRLHVPVQQLTGVDSSHPLGISLLYFNQFQLYERWNINFLPPINSSGQFFWNSIILPSLTEVHHIFFSSSFQELVFKKCVTRKIVQVFEMISIQFHICHYLLSLTKRRKNAN